MATQMIIRVESSLKKKVSQLAKAEGKNLSQIVRELLEKYTPGLISFAAVAVRQGMWLPI